VNNAGVAHDAPFPAIEREDWERVTRTTLDGFYNVTRPLVMPMVRRRWGRIVNVSSVSGVIGNRGQVNYSAAKAGLIGATLALAKEVAHRGVTVNAVAPGVIETEMSEAVRELAGDEIKGRILQRRFGQARDIAHAVWFLSSSLSDYVTGQVLYVDGGFKME
jgi:3-oxoacyl-[acyl-carrier protein] reductase